MIAGTYLLGQFNPSSTKTSLGSTSRPCGPWRGTWITWSQGTDSGRGTWELKKSPYLQNNSENQNFPYLYLPTRKKPISDTSKCRSATSSMAPWLHKSQLAGDCSGKKVPPTREAPKVGQHANTPVTEAASKTSDKLKKVASKMHRQEVLQKNAKIAPGCITRLTEVVGQIIQTCLINVYTYYNQVK